MKYTINEAGDAHEVMMQGTFGFADNVSVEQLVESLVDKRAGSVVLNLSSVEKIDSAGLGILLTLREAAQAKGQGVALSGMTGSVKEVLELACFDTLFSFES